MNGQRNAISNEREREFHAYQSLTVRMVFWGVEKEAFPSLLVGVSDLPLCQDSHVCYIIQQPTPTKNV